MNIPSDIDFIYDMGHNEKALGAVNSYHNRNGTESMLVLTIFNEEDARQEVAKFKNDIDGKVVIEIGAGVGFLALEMAKYAKHVYALEIDPAWCWLFTEHLYKNKPTNLTWIFGRAEDMVGMIKADIAVIFTCSGVEKMNKLGKTLARRVIIGPKLSKFQELPDSPTIEK